MRTTLTIELEHDAKDGADVDCKAILAAAKAAGYTVLSANRTTWLPARQETLVG